MLTTDCTETGIEAERCVGRILEMKELNENGSSGSSENCYILDIFGQI